MITRIAKAAIPNGKLMFRAFAFFSGAAFFYLIEPVVGTWVHVLALYCGFVGFNQLVAGAVIRTIDETYVVISGSTEKPKEEEA